MATIRKRGEGVYEVRVFVGRDERGKPIQRSKTVRGGKREAERVAAELETKPSRAGAKTVADALDAWVEMKTPTWAVSSKRDQVGRANALKADAIGSISVARLGVEEVDKWIARRRKQGKGEGTIRNQLQVLRSALRQAERWGWIADNPATKAELKRPKRVERGVMSDDEVFAVLDAAADLHDMAPIALRLAAVTGGGCRLRLPDLDGDRHRTDRRSRSVPPGDRRAGPTVPLAPRGPHGARRDARVGERSSGRGVLSVPVRSPRRPGSRAPRHPRIATPDDRGSRGFASHHRERGPPQRPARSIHDLGCLPRASGSVPIRLADQSRAPLLWIADAISGAVSEHLKGKDDDAFNQISSLVTPDYLA